MNKTDYETFVNYVTVKHMIHAGSNLYFRLNELCKSKDDLAKKIFRELKRGCFNADSDAGAEFYTRYRKYVDNSHTVNEFESRLQAEFPTMKERLDDLLEKRDHLRWLVQ